MNRIVHLIPFDAIGGVERAARSIENGIYGDIEFKVDTIYPRSAGGSFFILWNPWYVVKSITTRIIWPPQVLIVSLWRAYFVGIFVKIFRPHTKLVVFLHSSEDVHLLDWLLTRWSVKLSNVVWADSNTTLTYRLRDISPKRSKVISFITERIELQEMDMIGEPKPRFMYWGRLHRQKGLDRAILIFEKICGQFPMAHFDIIGPDGGDRNRLEELAREFRLFDAITFRGPMDFESIKEESRTASFYLQTSELEGMAMSVVEAMQLGLVPIVTPVGEIEHYCIDGENAIVIHDDDKAVHDTVELISNSDIYNIVRSNAMKAWSNNLLYKEDVLQACADLLNPCAA